MDLKKQRELEQRDFQQQSKPTLPCQGLEMITFIIYNPWLQTSFLLISDYLENPVLEVLSKFSTSHNTANIYGSGAGSY